MSLAKPIALILRGLEFLWSLIILGVVGTMIHNSPAGDPSIVNYSLVVGILGMASLIYLIPATLRESLAISPLFPLIVDLVNVLFWFCGAVAMAAELGVHSCNNQDYLKNNGITNGVKDGKSSRCVSAQATCAFLFFGFFAFLGSAIFSGLNARGGSVRPGIRRGPAMSQV